MSTTKSSDHVATANLMLTGILSAATYKDWNKRIAGVGTAGNGSGPVLASEQAIAMLRMAGAGGKMEGDPKVWLGIVGSWLAVLLQFLFALLLCPWMLFHGTRCRRDLFATAVHGAWLMGDEEEKSKSGI
ncbi:hypothetical protein WG66_012634 [Moniliophthora roreri]|nr:hypothetical protein WG66_012634 [Moniliophthora roreri]